MKACFNKRFSGGDAAGDTFTQMPFCLKRDKRRTWGSPVFLFQWGLDSAEIGHHFSLVGAQFMDAVLTGASGRSERGNPSPQGEGVR